MKELEGESSPKSPGRLPRSRHRRFGQSLPASVHPGSLHRDVCTLG